MDAPVTVVGNLTRDPELRYTASGMAVATLGVAVNRRWQDRQSKEWKEETSFFNCVAWAELAENIAESVSKGDRVVIQGELQQRSWENAEGEKRSTVEVKILDLGASLRWATASLTKTQRKAGGYGDQPPHPADEAPAEQPVPAGHEEF